MKTSKKSSAKEKCPAETAVSEGPCIMDFLAAQQREREAATSHDGNGGGNNTGCAVTSTDDNDRGGWCCHKCGQENSSLGKRCGKCMAWRSGVRGKRTKKPVGDTSNSSVVATPTTPTTAGTSTTASIVTPKLELEGDAALAAALAESERARFRRSRTKVARFDPGGNPNVLDKATPKVLGSPTSTSDSSRNRPPASNGAIDTLSKVESYVGPAGHGKRSKPGKQLQRQKEKEKESCTDTVPTFKSRGGSSISQQTPSPKISWRKPGRLNKEEEHQLRKAEEATVERLNNILRAYEAKEPKEEKIEDDIDEQSDEERNEFFQVSHGGVVGEATWTKNIEHSKELPQIVQSPPHGKRKRSIHVTFVDLLSKPQKLAEPDKVGVESMAISFKSALLALSHEEALKVHKQLRASGAGGSFSEGVGCTVTLRSSPAHLRSGSITLDIESISKFLSGMLLTYLLARGETDEPRKKKSKKVEEQQWASFSFQQHPPQISTNAAAKKIGHKQDEAASSSVHAPAPAGPDYMHQPPSSCPMSQPGVATPSNDVLYPRKDKSIGVLARKFVAAYANYPAGTVISLVDTTEFFGVTKRRVYDLMNVFEALEIITKISKDMIKWNCTIGLPLFLARLQQDAFYMYSDEAIRNKLLKKKCDDHIPLTTLTFVDALDNKDVLRRLTLQCLRLLVVRNTNIDFEEISKRILGGKEDGDIATEAETRQLKNNSRRLYDVINILTGLDIVEEGRALRKASFAWKFRVAVKDLPEILAAQDSTTPFRTRTESLVDADQSYSFSICPNGNISAELPRMAMHLVMYQADSQEDIVTSSAVLGLISEDETLSSLISRINSDDLAFWSAAPGGEAKVRRASFLHRLMRPLCIRIELSGRERQTNQRDTTSTSIPSTQDTDTEVYIVPFSLLDVLLRCKLLQPYFVEGIIRRIQTLHRSSLGLRESMQKQLLRTIEPLAFTNVRPYLLYQLRGLINCFQGNDQNRLLELLPKELSDAVSIDRITGESTESAAPNFIEPMNIKVTAKGKTRQYSMEARSCWSSSREMQMKIREERKRLINEYEEKIQEERERETNNNLLAPSRRSSRHVLQKDRSSDGALIFSEAEMTLSDFLDRRKLMKAVNKTLPREYIKGVSKSALSQLPLSSDDVQELKCLFFDADGSLRNDVKSDVDSGAKNDPRYIVFQNIRCDSERKDRRWQVPIRHHSTGVVIGTRARVEEIFIRAGIFEDGCEALNEMGLLFGGTEDQSLHHDTARQITSWMKSRPLAHRDEQAEYSSIPGWEIDRLEYNAAMASPYAPESFLVGLHGKETIFLGVQKDHVIKCSEIECSVRGGKDGEVFPIIRENDHLVVVEAKYGAQFTGDFPHAGVRNFKGDSEEQQLMNKLNAQIEAINQRYPAHERVLRTKAVVELMCNFPNLNKLCRLHCSTEMLKGHIQIPENTIGFDGCLPNEPDTRCFQDDPQLEPFTTCTPLDNIGYDLSEIEPAEEIGKGWTVKKTKRYIKDRSGRGRERIETLYFSPSGKRFRSVKAALTFLNPSQSSDSKAHLVTPEKESYTSVGQKVCKYFFGTLHYGAVFQYEDKNNILVKWNEENGHEGDYELIKECELKRLVLLWKENQAVKEREQSNEAGRPDEDPPTDTLATTC